ncbi:hypothetical protein GALMADRAFT_816265 [Galerina marginata CBS 339.88]|uniref:Uncharacterized protein n=1 Tax=Galerina marginata (strain CBS 339.88) TaxID=685588 RepID=A0A067TTL2_GALM3|nr:hypothetical protein GALMADRAFT_816265 [Galerina marginata CBS 339.88]
MPVKSCTTASFSHRHCRPPTLWPPSLFATLAIFVATLSLTAVPPSMHLVVGLTATAATVTIALFSNCSLGRQNRQPEENDQNQVEHAPLAEE